MDFHLPSSDGQRNYLLIVELLENRVIIDCDCPAGKRGKLCKHKLALLQGNAQSVVLPEEMAAYRSLVANMPSTTTHGLFTSFLKAERDMNRSKENLEAAKQALEQDLSSRRRM